MYGGPHLRRRQRSPLGHEIAPAGDCLAVLVVGADTHHLDAIPGQAGGRPILILTSAIGSLAAWACLGLDVSDLRPGSYSRTARTGGYLEGLFCQTQEGRVPEARARAIDASAAVMRKSPQLGSVVHQRHNRQPLRREVRPHTCDVATAAIVPDLGDVWVALRGEHDLSIHAVDRRLLCGVISVRWGRRIRLPRSSSDHVSASSGERLKVTRTGGGTAAARTRQPPQLSCHAAAVTTPQLAPAKG
eukprot:COSAG01_NODE_5000_length_4554_cov_8.000449_2_plen_245_part_00